jgi:hypothetical protein
MAVIGAAVAFAVAGAVASEATYFINKATDHTAEEAAKRNKAMMDLQEAQADYAKRKQAQAEWLNEEMRKESHAEVEYKQGEDAMDAYFEATHGMSRQEALGPEPTLADFYTPSDTTKNIELRCSAERSRQQGGLYIICTSAQKSHVIQEASAA